MINIFLDLCPSYVPFLVQCSQGDGTKINPTVDNLIIYEEGGADASFDSGTITGSPFDPAQINSKTGLWGVLVDKSLFTVGKFYIALWEMTVDGVTTAKVERYFVCNAASFKATGFSTHSASDVVTAMQDTGTKLTAIHAKLPSKTYLTGTGNSDGDVDIAEATGNFPGTVGKSAMSLAAADVSGNLPADLKVITPEVDLSTAMKASINAEADTALSDAGVTSTRTGLLDKLNITGNVASSPEVTAIQNNTRIVKVVPQFIERPDSGTQNYIIHLYLYDETGNMEAPDSAPTVTLVNQSGTDRSSRLDSATMALVGTGHYKCVYTVSSMDAIEQLLWEFAVVENGSTRYFGDLSMVVDTTAVDFTASDRTDLQSILEQANKLQFDPSSYVKAVQQGGVTLDSSERVKLDVDQPDYPPAQVGDEMGLSGDAQAYIDGAVNYLDGKIYINYQAITSISVGSSQPVIEIQPSQPFAIFCQVNTGTAIDALIVYGSTSIPLVLNQDFTFTPVNINGAGWKKFTLINTELITEAMIGQDVKLIINTNDPD